MYRARGRIKTSVILATYNGNHDRLTEAIDSVLLQSYKNFEFIIINDASTNDIEKTILRYVEQDERIVYLKNNINLERSASRNKGMKSSKGEYIAFIDDDDVWCDSTKLAQQVEFMINNPDHGLCGTGVITTNEQGEELGKTLHRQDNQNIKNTILGSNQFALSSTIVRRSIIEHHNLYFQEKLSLAEDYDMRLRIGQVSKLHNLPIYGLKYRTRPGSTTGKHYFHLQMTALKISRKYKKHYPHPMSGILKHCISTFLPKQFVQWLVRLTK